MFSPDFQLLQDIAVPSLQGRAQHFRHRCGMEVFCLDTPDRENLFALYFSTPPSDNTGVAHILEHAVLSGSQKFPLRDPFIELVKSSLATFINAMTFADYTVYPVSSCHENDFFNLAEVYWDSVFHPLLSRQSFQQEGWHYEIEESGKKKTKLSINGIVLNEMSGAYAEMENLLERSIWQYLLPDSHLAFDSGGHPEQIPLLSYEQFLEYYKNHYQPAKAKVVFIGNIPLERKLKFIAQQLGDLPASAKTEECPSLPSPRKWRRPRQKRAYYVPEPGGENDQSGALVFAWRTNDNRDPDVGLAMQLLDLILLGNQSAPMAKKLLESGLCNAMTNSGYDDSSRQTIFQIGVKGCKTENFDQLEKIIFDCLEEQSRGINKKCILAAMRQLRLERAEIGPEYNLDILDDIVSAWNANCDQPTFLNQEKNWQKLESNLAQKPAFLENLLKKYFLSNPHRLRLELLPDHALLSKRERRVIARLRRRQSSMSPFELHSVQEEQLSLLKAQQKPDSLSAKRRLPRLNREQLSLSPQHLPAHKALLSNQIPLLIGDVFTNQITYLQLAFDINTLPQELKPALPFFSSFFHQVGTEDKTYDIIAQQQAEASFAIRCGLIACDQANGLPNQKNLLVVSTQCLDECLPEALELLQQQINNKSFQETKRCQEIIRQHWANIMAEMQSNGGAFACLRGAAGLTSTASALDEWNGLPHVQQAKKWREMCQQDLRKKQELLKELANWLSYQTPAVASYAGGRGTEAQVTAFLQQFHPLKQKETFSNNRQLPISSGRSEFFPLNAEVSSFARVLAAPHFTDPHSAGLEVYAQLLACGHLWREIRLKNGAYNVHCQYSPFRRIMLLQSGDDPNPRSSKTVFERLAKITDKLKWDERDISDAIIACSRTDERPWRPAQVTHSALLHQITGFNEEMRAQRRGALLAQTPESVRAAADDFWMKFSNLHNDCLLGPTEHAQELNLTTFQI